MFNELEEHQRHVIGTPPARRVQQRRHVRGDRRNRQRTSIVTRLNSAQGMATPCSVPAQYRIGWRETG